MAAALIQYRTCEEIAVALKTDYATLALDRRDLPPRHRSFQAVFDYSWQLLSPEEAQTLMQCSVFRGGFTETAVQAIALAPPAHLFALNSKSFLRQTETERYVMHELVRQFAAEKLDGEGETAVRNRHCAYFTKYIDQHWEEFDNDPYLLQTIKVDMDNIRAAWNWGMAMGNFFAIQHSVMGLSLLFRLIGLFEEARTTFAYAIQHLRTQKQEPHVDYLLALFLVEQSYFRERSAQLDDAFALAEEAVALGEKLEDKFIIAQANLRLAAIAYNQGRMQDSRRFCEVGLGIAQQEKLRRVEVIGLAGMGLTLAQIGEMDLALEYHLRSVKVAHNRRYRRFEALLTTNLGTLYRTLGQSDKALPCYQNAVTLTREIGDADYEGIALTNQGLTYYMVGHFSQAQSSLEESLHIFTEIGNQLFQAMVTIYLAMVLLPQGKLDLALQLGRRGHALALQTGSDHIKIRACLIMGQILNTIKDHDESLEYLVEALTYVEQDDVPKQIMIQALTANTPRLPWAPG